jgi:DAACS family dicarboxylate/amino acid:cation (Na+ or H+) symporter
MDQSPPAAPDAPEPDRPPGYFGWWHARPLYLRILAACLLGVVVGLILGDQAAPLRVPSRLVLQLLTALAAPLVMVAVVQALMQAQIPRGSALKLISLLVLNTMVAIAIGLTVATVIQPGKWTTLQATGEQSAPLPQADPLAVSRSVPRA